MPLIARDRVGHGLRAWAAAASCLFTSEWTFPSLVGFILRTSLLSPRGLNLSLKELIRLTACTHSLSVSLQPPSPADFPGPPSRRSSGRAAFATFEALFGCPTARRAFVATSSFDS